jgi:hypothetical protein
MNYERVSELHEMLSEEYNKTPVNNGRIAEINHYISKEFIAKDPFFWTRFLHLPDDWKTYVTSLIGALIVLNTQFHWVSQDTQNALLAAAVSLGFWAVNSVQKVNFAKLKTHVAMLMHRK